MLHTHIKQETYTHITSKKHTHIYKTKNKLKPTTTNNTYTTPHTQHHNLHTHKLREAFISIASTSFIGGLVLLDASGRTLISENGKFLNKTIDLSSYDRGIYFLQMEVGGKFLSEKIVLQ